MRRTGSGRTHLRHWARAALAATIVVAAACRPFRRGSNQPPAVLYFTNESLDQADVFAVASSGYSVRIGTVLPGQTDTLVVPRDMAAQGGTVNVVARLLARSITPQTGPVAIHPGEALEVRLPIDQKLLTVLPAQP